MITREHIDNVLDRIRPFLKADGGDIEVVSVDEHEARVRFTGVCANCPSANMTLHMGVESLLRREIPELQMLHLVGERK